VGQAEMEQKYVGISGKHIRYFTPPRVSICCVPIQGTKVSTASVTSIVQHFSAVNTVLKVGDFYTK